MELYHRIGAPNGVFDRMSRSIEETEGQGSPRIDDRQVARPVAPPDFECCRFCLRLVADGCRRHGKCLRQQYYEGAISATDGFPLSVILDALAAPHVEHEHDLHRLADDGGPCHEADL